MYHQNLISVGHHAHPGRIEPATTEYTVILADEFSSDARLTHFAAFFATQHTVCNYHFIIQKLTF